MPDGPRRRFGLTGRESGQEILEGHRPPGGLQNGKKQPLRRRQRLVSPTLCPAPQWGIWNEPHDHIAPLHQEGGFRMPFLYAPTHDVLSAAPPLLDQPGDVHDAREDRVGRTGAVPALEIRGGPSLRKPTDVGDLQPVIVQLHGDTPAAMLVVTMTNRIVHGLAQRIERELPPFNAL